MSTNVIQFPQDRRDAQVAARPPVKGPAGTGGRSHQPLC